MENLEHLYEEIKLIKDKPLFEAAISIGNHKIFYKYTKTKYYFYIYELLDKLCKKSPYENNSSIFHLSLYFILKILYQCENTPYLSNLDLIILNCFSLGIKSIVKQKDFPSINRIKKIYEEKYINYNNEEICEGEIICLKLLNYDINILTAYECVIYLTQNDLKLRELSLIKLEFLMRNNLMQFIYKSSLDIAKNCITTIKEKIILKEPKIIKKKIVSINGFCCSPGIKKYSSTDKLGNSSNKDKDNDTNNFNEEIKINEQQFGLMKVKKLNLLNNKNSSLKNSADKIYYKKNCNIIQQNSTSCGSLITESNSGNNIINLKRKVFFKKINKPFNKFIYHNFEQNNEIKKKSTEVSKKKVYLNNNRYYFDNNINTININLNNTQVLNDNNNYNNFNNYNIQKENNKNYMNLFLHKKDFSTRFLKKNSSEENNQSYFNNSFFKGIKSKIETKSINLGALTKSVIGSTNFQRYNISTRQIEGHEKMNSSNLFNNSVGSQDGPFLTNNNTIGNYYIQW